MKRKMETAVLTALFVLLATLLLILAKTNAAETEHRGTVELPQNAHVIFTENHSRSRTERRTLQGAGCPPPTMFHTQNRSA